jgi:hypothetical protein
MLIDPYGNNNNYYHYVFIIFIFYNVKVGYNGAVLKQIQLGHKFSDNFYV